MLYAIAHSLSHVCNQQVKVAIRKHDDSLREIEGLVIDIGHGYFGIKHSVDDAPTERTSYFAIASIEYIQLKQ